MSMYIYRLYIFVLSHMIMANYRGWNSVYKKYGI